MQMPFIGWTCPRGTSDHLVWKDGKTICGRYKSLAYTRIPRPTKPCKHCMRKIKQLNINLEDTYYELR